MAKAKAMLAELHDLATAIPKTGADMAKLCADEARSQALMFGVGGLEIDLTRQTITLPQYTRLLEFAERQKVLGQCMAMQEGAVVNKSEGRGALHSMARNRQLPMTQKSIATMAGRLTQLKQQGMSDIISIGIGGSDLGPMMAVAALAGSEYQTGVGVHFVSSLDPAHLQDVVAGLSPKTTAAVIISKSFTTMETLANMAGIKAWFEAAGVDASRRMLAITANQAAAEAMGFGRDQCLLFDEGVGGRYSLWSAVGFGIMASIGEEAFCQMLDGGAEIDAHVRATKTTPAKNAPLGLALMRFWNASILGRAGEAVLPYSHRLRHFPLWAQQLEMESNGKISPLATDLDMNMDMATAPIVFGSGGSQAQHAFFQHLHQSPMITPVTMLVSRDADTDTDAKAKQHRTMVLQILAQADALALGDFGGDLADGESHFTGGRPSSIITWHRLTPHVLGQLLALYEYATMMAGWLWQVNSFDQPGVELGKRMAKQYAEYYDQNASPPKAMTPASRAFIKRLQDSK